jgi:HEAT repeat protein
MAGFTALAAGSSTPGTSLDRIHTSFAILLTLAALGGLAFGLYQIGLIGFLLRAFGAWVRGCIRAGFWVWEQLFARASWPVFLATVTALIVVGEAVAGPAPWLAVSCGLAALFAGVTACLAYMFIDIERYEVERGYKAVHDPLKGQALAVHLVRYGDRVGVPLLAAAAVGAVGGFALLNQGLYETIGGDWYAIGDEKESPGYADFLAYSVINLYQIVDLLDLAGSHNLLRFTYVQKAKWPAGILLTSFKTFFTLVLLQQIFASVRQGQALAAAIADFWSPHPPIHERARYSLPRHGVGVVRPLLASLRAVPALTREQRDQLPRVIAGIGPGAIPALVEHLGDSHEGVRGISATALSLLHALDALPVLARLTQDPSEIVRREAVEALGVIGGPGVQMLEKRSRLTVGRRAVNRFGWMFGRRGASSDAHQPDRVRTAVSALAASLADPDAAVRSGAARALGRIGPAAAPAVPNLLQLLKDADETVRCRTAEALGQVRDAAAVPALAAELAGPGSPLKEVAVRALGEFKEAARPAVPALVALLNDPDEFVRHAAGETVARVGPLPGAAAAALTAGLASPDTLVQAQTAESLGAVGVAAATAAPALVAALASGSDRVRAKAAEALGKIGEAVAEVAVPSLVLALRDRDNWVSALAAEALGEMGEAAEEAVPALIRSLRHLNPLVRANAAEALGKLGEAGSAALASLAAAAADADGLVRTQAIRAFGDIAPPGPEAEAVLIAGLRDTEPRVRAAAAETLGRRISPGESAGQALLPLLDDPNNQVRFHAIRVLPRLSGPAPGAVEGLCRRLSEDDSPWIREAAAQSLGSLGPAAAASGTALLRAARTGEALVREEAVRAIAMIQPPEAAEALIAGMTDACPEVRVVASAGWMKAGEIPSAAVPVLVEALRDPEVQVRANAAHALARLAALPPEAIMLLIECAADPNDGLRLNAAVALREAAGGVVGELFDRLLGDPNSRIRLIAAGAILARSPANVEAASVVAASLSDPALRLRQVALEAVASHGDGGLAFWHSLIRRAQEEDDPGLRERVTRLLDSLKSAVVMPATFPPA